MPQEVSDLDPLELEGQVFDCESPDVSVRTKHGFSGRAEHALNC